MTNNKMQYFKVLNRHNINLNKNNKLNIKQFNN